MMQRLMLLALFLLVALPLRAQTEGAIPFTLAADSVFPMGIAFRLAADVPPDDVLRLRLTISSEDAEDAAQVVDFDPEELPRDRTFIVVDYIWDSTSAVRPQLFQAYEYRWQLTTRGERSLDERGLIEYVDDRAEWLRLETAEGNLRLALPHPADGDGQGLARVLGKAYTLLRTNTAANPQFKYLVYPADLPLTCQRGSEGEDVILRSFPDEPAQELPCDAARFASAFAQAGLELVQLRPGLSVAAQVLPRMVDVFYADFWDGGPVPAWFRAGLAEFHLPLPDSGALETLRQTLRVGRPYSLAQMEIAPAGRDDVWRAQAIGMVRYMADRAGVPALFGVAARAANPEGFAAVYELIIGESLALLLPNLTTWAFSQAALNAFAYQPYLPETPTPQPSATATLTRTPEPPTETATATRAVTATPRPPHPTRTSTPTITPLPPRSFVLASPTPQATPIPPGGRVLAELNQEQMLVIVGALLLVLILGGLALRRR